MKGDLESLGKLQAEVDGEISELVFPRENRPFTPHMTLGRVRDQSASSERLGITAAISNYSMDPTEAWLVESVRLVRSNLGPGGVTYSDLATVPLVDTGSLQNCHSEEPLAYSQDKLRDEESGAGLP